MDVNSLILYGGPGTGKTFMAAQAATRAGKPPVWVVTRKTNLGGFNTWVDQNPQEAKRRGLARVPDANIIPIKKMTTDKEGNLVRANTMATIESVVRKYVQKVVKGEIDASGIVFDELSVFAKWAHEEIFANEKNGFEAIKQIKNWVGDLCEISEATDLPMIFICHAKDPKFHEDGPLRGRVLYQGGPAMPFGSMVAEVCALPDAVLHLESVQKPTGELVRVLKTHNSPQWLRKIRIAGVPAEVEDPDIRQILAKAGWEYPELNQNQAQA